MTTPSSLSTLASHCDQLRRRYDPAPAISRIDALLALLAQSRDALSLSVSPIPFLRQQAAVQLAALKNDQQDLYNRLTKYGKAIDKVFQTTLSRLFSPNFKADLSRASLPHPFHGNEPLVHYSIALHLIRQGLPDIAVIFMQEANISPPEDLMNEFSQREQILSSLRSGHLDPAIHWCSQNRKFLQSRGSSLEFDLHQLQFLKLFKNDPQAAYDYAYSTFSSFATRYLPQIQRLACSFLYASDISSSPYADLFSGDDGLHIVESEFASEFCARLGMNPEDPLNVIITAGAISIPILLKVTSIMKEKKNEWTSQGELPVETPLPPNFYYHRIFTCPVNKEQATEENPPMMLPCGHIYCRTSLQRMSKGLDSKIKCAYCPNMYPFKDAIQVWFP
ncbi:LisH domain-containing protein [Neolecta irregularis DAH-3]|uniref:GID complex catalytic subunit 2 n=1 Tax=Neolecta irregularis (strain DAH-3) TaxID=1198029 RepID=A0A1U7LPR5_NEOID|nr:LisH domain-containing protein [Neolecta irregularis DAH-3]|eukprot:OLL24618.1 LisH domain-containing protein [Neolecta irregularis DAH-3]